MPSLSRLAGRTALATAGVLAAGTLAGCGVFDSPDLVIYNAQHEELLDEIVPLFEEETGLDVELVELFHVYSDPARDQRMHTVSTVFIGRATGTPVGADDAAAAIVCKPDALPGPLVFDHARIVADYVAYKQRGVRPPPRR